MMYGGIDLHSNNSVVAVIDDTDRVVAQKRLPNDITTIVGFLVSIGPLIAVCCQAYISELANGKVVALAPSELVRVAETVRARLIHGLSARHWIAQAG
jgi:hypothetical protein